MKPTVAILVLGLLVACSRHQSGSAAVNDVLKSNYWKLAGADSFMDGGSFCLSFMNEEGEILHIVALCDSHRTNEDLQFELRTTYKAKHGMPVQSGSPLEKRVLWILQNYDKRPEIQIQQSYIDQMVSALRDRKMQFPFKPALLLKEAELTAPTNEALPRR